jgi:hypothetical protein
MYRFQPLRKWRHSMSVHVDFLYRHTSQLWRRLRLTVFKSFKKQIQLFVASQIRNDLISWQFTSASGKRSIRMSRLYPTVQELNVILRPLCTSMMQFCELGGASNRHSSRARPVISTFYLHLFRSYLAEAVHGDTWNRSQEEHARLRIVGYYHQSIPRLRVCTGDHLECLVISQAPNNYASGWTSC